VARQATNASSIGSSVQLSIGVSTNGRRMMSARAVGDRLLPHRHEKRRHAAAALACRTHNWHGSLQG
jgi:hypothetical protein